MVSTRPLISKSSSPFNNSLVTVPKALITLSIIVTLMLHSFSIPLQGRGIYPSFQFLSVLFCDQPEQQSPQFCKFTFFYNKVWSSSRDWIIVCMSKSHRSLCVCDSPGQMRGCAYTICLYGQV